MLDNLWRELKSRKIFRVATVYAAISWGVIQIADIMLPVLGVAEWVMASMVLTAFVGFPLVLLLGWIWDIRIEKRRVTLSSDDGLRLNPYSRAIEFLVIALFGISAFFVYYNAASHSAQADAGYEISVTEMLDKIPAQKSIAVLPFVSFSQNESDDYFADGLADEILNLLARNKQLRVAARTSSFQFKGTSLDIKSIGHELGVDYIVEGSVKRSGDLLRITAQLIRVSDSFNVFADSWDRKSDKVFEVQDEISMAVMRELEVKLLANETNTNNESGTRNIEALAAYSKGLSFVRNRGKADFEQAIELFDKALSYDPAYAEALAMKAETLLLQVSYGYQLFKTIEPQVLALLAQGEKYDASLADIFAVKGLYWWQKSGKVEPALLPQYQNKAKQSLADAIELNPSHAEAYMWLGSILQGEGKFDDGAQLRKKAWQLDPKAAVVGFNRAEDLVRYGRYEEAMGVFNSVVRSNPNYAAAYSIAGDVSFAVGQLDQAWMMYQKQAKLTDNATMQLFSESRILLPLKQYDKVQHNIDRLNEDTTKGMSGSEIKSKLENLQAELWIAEGRWNEFHQWVQRFDEQPEYADYYLWRGLSALKLQNWQSAINDFELAIGKVRENNAQRIDEMTVRIQLFLITAWKQQGNFLKSDNYKSIVKAEIEHLKATGQDSHAIRFFEASLAINLGENARALQILKQAVREGFVSLWWVENDPTFAPIVDDAQFRILKDELDGRLQQMRRRIDNYDMAHLGA